MTLHSIWKRKLEEQSSNVNPAQGWKLQTTMSEVDLENHGKLLRVERQGRSIEDYRRALMHTVGYRIGELLALEEHGTPVAFSQVYPIAAILGMAGGSYKKPPGGLLLEMRKEVDDWFQTRPLKITTLKIITTTSIKL